MNYIENDYDDYGEAYKNAKEKHNDTMAAIYCHYDDDRDPTHDIELTKAMKFIDIWSLMIAGIDTTSHAAEVGIILLAKYPNIQDIVHNELKDVYKNNDIHFRCQK